MSKEKTIVENIIARLEPLPDGTGYTWNGKITEIEVAALRKLAGLPVGGRSSDNTTESIKSPRVVAKIVLDDSSIKRKCDHDLTLCLDFGTAFSKAAATDVADKLVEIGLGATAGEPQLIFPVHSSLYIDDGRIWFGPQAIARSISDDDPKRRRFDSPKQEMSQGDLDSLKKQAVGREINPTDTVLTKGDLIELYLAYLTDLANSQLAAKGHRDLAYRRFARPCWSLDRATIANKAFREMLGACPSIQKVARK